MPSSHTRRRIAIGYGAFAVERAVTMRRAERRARLLAILVLPELVYDCFLNAAPRSM